MIKVGNVVIKGKIICLVKEKKVKIVQSIKVLKGCLQIIHLRYPIGFLK